MSGLPIIYSIVKYFFVFTAFILFPVSLVILLIASIRDARQTATNGPFLGRTISNPNADLKLVQVGPRRSTYTLIAKDTRPLASITVDMRLGWRRFKNAEATYGDTHWRFVKDQTLLLFPTPKRIRSLGSRRVDVYKNGSPWAEMSGTIPSAWQNLRISIGGVEKYTYKNEESRGFYYPGISRFMKVPENKVIIEIDKEGNVVLNESKEMNEEIVFLSVATIFILWNSTESSAIGSGFGDFIESFMYKN